MCPALDARWRPVVVCGAIVLALGCGREGPRDAREAALRENLDTFRSTLDQYRGDKGRYPASLNDLVAEGYLRSIPVDPMTRSRESWRLVYEYPGTPGPGETSRFIVVDVRSGSDARARDGTLYRSW